MHLIMLSRRESISSFPSETVTVGAGSTSSAGGRKTLLGSAEVCAVKFIIGEKENLCDGCA